MSQKPTVPATVWPFPVWDGTQWLTPLEQLTPAARKALRSEKKDSRTPDLSDIEDARF
jgi:hypothetical protein